MERKLYFDGFNKEIVVYLARLSESFDLVRLVDPISCTEWRLDKEGQELVEHEYECFSIWNRECRCTDCISSKKVDENGREEKLAFWGKELCHVIATPLYAGEKRYVLQMVTVIRDELFRGSYTAIAFTKGFVGYTDKLYLDPLTGAYNRGFLNDYGKCLPADAIAVIDLDNLKYANDTYGHICGDVVLKSVARTILDHIRDKDCLIRFGGDEFILTMTGIGKESFFTRLEELRSLVEKLEFEGYPELKVTLSIGCVECKRCDPETIDQADMLMYEAKKNKNRTVMR